MSDVRARFDGFLSWTLREELPLLRERVAAAELESFERYYRSLPDVAHAAAVARYLRGAWHGEAGYAARWIAARGAPRVLDAGSGFGSYSMLFAAMGAEVTGADLRPDRLAVAESRAVLYAERHGRPLALRYLRADLTREWPADFDLIWVYNALSHIHPLPAFLDQVRRHLAPGGVLVVGDINGGYLPHLRRLEHVRREVYQDYVTPDGERHSYAVERTFTPAEMRRTVREGGLRVLRHELYWGGLGVAGDALYRGVLSPVGRIWWLGAPVARRQLVVAGPAGGRP